MVFGKLGAEAAMFPFPRELGELAIVRLEDRVGKGGGEPDHTSTGV